MRTRNGQWDIPDLQRLLTDVIPKATAVVNFKVEHDFPDLGPRKMLVTARTLFHPDLNSHSMLLVIVDVTEQTQRADTKDLLFGELRHRTKNMFAMVQSLARRTETAGRSAEQYRDAFLGRLDALVSAQDLAFTDQGDTGLKALIERILSPFAGREAGFVIEGSAVAELPSSMGSPLSLVLHELSTNAVKYGALSAGGQVRISWQVDQEGQLRLNWVETGGPPVTPPEKTGFGTRLIQSLVSYSLEGHVEQTYAAEGLQVEVVIPLEGGGASK